MGCLNEKSNKKEKPQKIYPRAMLSINFTFTHLKIKIWQNFCSYFIFEIFLLFPKTEKERPGLKKLFINNCPIAICDGVLRSMFYFIIKQIKAHDVK